MIPKVKTWVVTVNQNDNLYKFNVPAPTRRLALLNFRFDIEYVGFNYSNVISIGLKRS